VIGREEMYQEGLLVVVSGPSGSGKGTILNLLMKQNDKVRSSISATTRKPREGEADGVNYFFKSIDEFQEMIKKQELIEWVEYCNNYYGTPRAYIENTKNQGFDVILEIEVEGAVNIKKKYPDCVLVFILPPSFDELKKRIENRGTENDKVIEQRLERAKKEIEYIKYYDYVIINDVLQDAVDNLNSILKSERFKFSRNADILNRLKYKE
jgi:guanylate kinase